MGFMDELKKLTQPYDDEEDFFEGADDSFKPQPKVKAKAEPKIKNPISAAEIAFENNFSDNSVSPAEEPGAPREREGGGLFGARPQKKQPRQKPARRSANFGRDTSVMLFSPQSFDEAGELVSFLQEGRTVVMTLEGVPGETARRLLDFLSGIAFALQGKITPVSAKTYFITPQDVDILGAQQQEQAESEAHYF